MKPQVDSVGNEIKAGCTLLFSYGIPPVEVAAKVIKRGRELIALTPGHDPAEANVREITPFFDCLVQTSQEG